MSGASVSHVAGGRAEVGGGKARGPRVSPRPPIRGFSRPRGRIPSTPTRARGRGQGQVAVPSWLKPPRCQRAARSQPLRADKPFIALL